jgi:hypothetical protein
MGASSNSRSSTAGEVSVGGYRVSARKVNYRVEPCQRSAMQLGAVFADSDGITRCFEDKDASVRI